MKYLEQKFVQNEPLRQVHQQRLKTAIKWGLVKKKISLHEFQEALAKEGVNVVLRQSNNGNIYGITYVDFKTKCVFNGSDMGKEYSAKGILEQLRPEQKQEALNQSKEQSNQIKYSNGSKSQSEQNHEQGN